jgi:hypothetical protein
MVSHLFLPVAGGRQTRVLAPPDRFPANNLQLNLHKLLEIISIETP